MRLPDPNGPLSDREIEVLDLVAEDMANKQIARRLNVTESTVKCHIASLMAKTGARSRVGLAVYHVRGIGRLERMSLKRIA